MKVMYNNIFIKHFNMINNHSVKNDSAVDLATIGLFTGYPDSLLTFARVCCMVFMIIGIPGNLVTLIALASCRKFHNATAFFIISLHISNLISCCMVLPMVFTTYSMRHWIFGSTMCGVYALMKYSLNGTAHFIVVAITVTRYIMVCHPFMYPRIFKRKCLILLLISTWVAGFGLFFPSFLGVWGKFDLDLNGSDCTMVTDKNGHCPKSFFVIFAFAGPYVVISFCYFRIWWTVRKTMKIREHNIAGTQPISSNSGSNPSVTENGDICKVSPVCESSTEDEIHGPNSISLTPDGRENNKTKFFKAAFRFTKKENRLHMPTRKDKKLATMILAILISFAICHLPLMMTRALYGGYKSDPIANIIAHLLEYCTAFISPIIYVIMSNEYRQAYTGLFDNLKIKSITYFAR